MRIPTSVTLQKPQCLGRLRSNYFYMFVPAEVITNGNVELFAAVNKCVTMELVFCLTLIAFFGDDSDNLHFSGWNFICHIRSYSSKL